MEPISASNWRRLAARSVGGADGEGWKLRRCGWLLEQGGGARDQLVLDGVARRMAGSEVKPWRRMRRLARPKMAIRVLGFAWFTYCWS